MERTYYIQDEEVEIEEVEEIIGLKIKEEPEKARESARKFGEIADELSEEDEIELNLTTEEQEGFAKAGWILVHPTSDAERSVDRHESYEEIDEVQKVYHDSDGRAKIGTDRLTVQLNEDLSESEVTGILQELGLTKIRNLEFAPNFYEVRTVGEQDALEMSSKLHSNANFILAEPELIEYIPPRYKPSDPEYSLQWQWNNSGSSGGTAGADISAETAWDLEQGDNISIAVIDSGFDLSHPDLRDAVSKGAAYFGDGGSLNISPYPHNNYPNGHHGTFCAGMALARTDNNSGGCGAAPRSDFMPIATLRDTVGTQATLARAVAYAVDPSTERAAREEGLTAADGADVISCSFGPRGTPWAMQTVLRLAIDSAKERGRNGRGTPIFWAVDNENVPISQDEVCSHPDTIAVGRSNRQDRQDGSAFGPELDFLAPGRDVYSTTVGGKYDTDSGTSYATPCAAGVGALVLAANPDQTPQEIREVLRSTCDKIGDENYDSIEYHDRYGSGRINAARAVSQAAGSEISEEEKKNITNKATQEKNKTHDIIIEIKLSIPVSEIATQN